MKRKRVEVSDHKSILESRKLPNKILNHVLRNACNKEVNLFKLCANSKQGIVLFTVQNTSAPNCTNHASYFNDNLEGFKKNGFNVVCLTSSPCISLNNWSKKYEFNYMCLSDPDHIVIGEIGAKQLGNTVRGHMILANDGRVIEEWKPRSPDQSVCEALSITNSILEKQIMKQHCSCFVVLVFGKILLPSGLPSPTLARRMHHAQELFLREDEKYDEGYLFLSDGDLRKTGITEAKAMLKLLMGEYGNPYPLSVRDGTTEHLQFGRIPNVSKRVVLDEISLATIETCPTFRAFMEKLLTNRRHEHACVHIVTSNYHMHRAYLYLTNYFTRTISEEHASRLVASEMTTVQATKPWVNSLIKWVKSPHDSREISMEAEAGENAYEHSCEVLEDGTRSTKTIRQRAESGMEVSRLLEEGRRSTHAPSDPAKYKK